MSAFDGVAIDKPIPRAAIAVRTLCIIVPRWEALRLLNPGPCIAQPPLGPKGRGNGAEAPLREGAGFLQAADGSLRRRRNRPIARSEPPSTAMLDGSPTFIGGKPLLASIMPVFVVGPI